MLLIFFENIVLLSVSFIIENYKLSGTTIELLLFTLAWTNGVDESAQVSLLTGTNAATMTPTGDSFTIKGSDGEYEWKVNNKTCLITKSS